MFRPTVPVKRVSMCRFRNGEFWFLKDGCLDKKCLDGDYHLCSKKHQIMKRNATEESSSNEPPISESHVELNFQPKMELLDDLVSQVNSASLDECIELSDYSDDSEDERGHFVDYDTQVAELRRFMMKYDHVMSFFSTNMTLNEVDLKNLNFELFDNKLDALLTNERPFGSSEYYPDSLNRLNGNRWLDDKIMDEFFTIISKKCRSCGKPVVAISTHWFNSYQVCFYHIYFTQILLISINLNFLRNMDFMRVVIFSDLV